MLTDAPLFLRLKSKEIGGRDYRREPETKPGVILEQKNVVDLSTAVLSRFETSTLFKTRLPFLGVGCLEVYKGELSALKCAPRQLHFRVSAKIAARTHDVDWPWGARGLWRRGLLLSISH